MLFNSVQFFVFFLLVAPIAWALFQWPRARVLFFTVASYYFYMCWDWRFSGLILASTILDFWVGHALYRATDQTRRIGLLCVSLCGNLGILAYFKYFAFFTREASAFAAAAGLAFEIPYYDILLPVGISFYTFQTLSYTIDIYRGQLRPTDSFLDFAMFVAFFPQLVAGPIVRAADFLPQIRNQRRFDNRLALDGVALMILGLFKKVCIADVLAVTFVDPVFNDPTRFSGLAVLLAVYGYAMQIYCDFSGYSDVAIGASQVLGFELPINFRRPYRASTITDFWRRWHISLSSWLKDYVYIPLGGNRTGVVGPGGNLMITMLLGGLWHGAAWTFVLWGGLHGLFLAVERVIYRGTSRTNRGLISGIVTFHLVCLGWILFRCDSVDTVILMTGRILTMTAGQLPISAPFVAALALGYLAHLSPAEWKDSLRRIFCDAPPLLQAAAITACILTFVAVDVGKSPFIYFQF